MRSGADHKSLRSSDGIRSSARHHRPGSFVVATAKSGSMTRIYAPVRRRDPWTPILDAGDLGFRQLTDGKRFGSVPPQLGRLMPTGSGLPSRLKESRDPFSLIDSTRCRQKQASEFRVVGWHDSEAVDSVPIQNPPTHEKRCPLIPSVKACDRAIRLTA